MSLLGRFSWTLPRTVQNLPREVPTVPTTGMEDPRFTVRKPSSQTLPPTFGQPIRKLGHKEKYVPSGAVSGVVTPVRSRDKGASGFAVAVAIGRVGRRGR